MKISINPPKSSSVIQLKTFQRFGSVLKTKAETHPINF
ncbi:hypothetical protein HPHPH44_0335 [Helicobacter pylori Hp H-44]|nr:hypothetical protein HPHPH44_0335 [Helicobacter pylori Hp H-44]